MSKWPYIAVQRTARVASLSNLAAAWTAARLLRILAIATGTGWAIAFVVIGPSYQLQMFGDGSIFSYSVAVDDAWAFHWHNITGRVFVYLFSCVPAETYVTVTKNAHGGILIYGFLFFVAQLAGLMATWAVDRSQGRIIFSYACGSTACLCPLTFGFPTEVWMAHALFWPALALCHYAPRGIGGTSGVFTVLLALAFTHEGALIFVVAILATVLLRGSRAHVFIRTGRACFAVIAVWALVKAAFPPDQYFAAMFARAALNVFSVTIFTNNLVLLLSAALATYAIVFYSLRRLSPTNALAFGVSIAALALAAYWLWFDQALHTDNRYYMRTIVLLATPMLGTLAAVYAIRADGRSTLMIAFLPRLMSVLASDTAMQAAAGALLLVLLVHMVETAKFVTAWTRYRAAVGELAMGTASDPELGDPRFVSSARIGPDLNRLSWSSTTTFLSVLVTPDLAPSRLVVDPNASYFWITCETATANEMEDGAIPVVSRQLVRAYACLHR